MFDALTQRLDTALGALRGRAVLTETDVDAALAEVRVALLEADVALPVARAFIADARARAVGRDALAAVDAGAQVVKHVHDALVEMLGGRAADGGASPAADGADGSDGLAPDLGLRLGGEPPAAIMLAGLQGCGKTTTAAKVALRLTKRARRRVLMASLDVARPAAQAQLAALGERAGVDTLPIVAGQQPVEIARRAMAAGRAGGYDAVILDTAGRLHVDDALMAEAAAVHAAVGPSETLLVADAMTGQDAVAAAQGFHERLGLTGIVLTRADGDARGGAALSMRHVTGRPIRFLGVGEGLEDLEEFHPDRVARRILGMGDVVSLVERARETIAEADAAAMESRLRAGQFDLNDMAAQLAQMRKMGGMEGLMKLLPGVGAAQKQMAAAGFDESLLRRQEALLSSMTPAERRDPDLLRASRKRRVAAGAGSSVQEVNRLLKQHKMMAKMMRRAGRDGGKGLTRALGGALEGGGFRPPGGAGRRRRRLFR